MKMQKTMVIAAVTLLAVAAAFLGCTSLGEGFLIPVEPEPTGPRFAFVVNGNPDDFGAAVTLGAYTVNPTTGALTAVAGSPFATGVLGSFLFMDVDPQGRFLFMPEGAKASTVAVYAIDQDTGALSEIAGSPFDTGGPGVFAVKVHPNGRFLYAVNRGDDSVSLFTIATNGSLTLVGAPLPTLGQPFFPIIDPQGRFLYITETGGVPGGPAPEVVVDGIVQGFAINATTGALTEVPGSPFPVGSGPRSGTVDGTGHFIFVTNRQSDTLSVFSIDQTSGELTEVAASPFVSGDGPFHAVDAVNGTNRYVAVNNINGPNVSVYQLNTTSGALTEVAGSPFTFNGWSRPQWTAVDPTGRFGYVVDWENTITGVTVDASGNLVEIPGSPFTTGGLNFPGQIVVR